MSLRYTVQHQEEYSSAWVNAVYVTPTTNVDKIMSVYKDMIFQHPYSSVRIVSLTPENVVFEVLHFKKGKALI